MKDYRGVRIEYHILQSFPVTCLNRDDVGMPKTARVGGVERSRVSSQCWKRQVRLALKDSGIKLGVRTKRIAEMIISFCNGEMTESKQRYIEALAKTLSDDTLLFLSEKEATAIAAYADGITDYESAIKAVDKKKTPGELWKVMKPALSKGLQDLNALDIALFGRMVANATEMNIEAACSFSHAITTHKVASSVDYFTAVDDFKSADEDSGAGHIGSSEFSSGTYYRYVSLDLGLLAETLGDADIDKAVIAFTKALYSAVPAARQTTMTGYCPWNYAHVFVRRGQGMQLSFDKPVRSEGNGYVIPSIESMEEELDRCRKLSGSMWGGIGEFLYGKDDDYTIDSLCDSLTRTLDSLPDKEA